MSVAENTPAQSHDNLDVLIVGAGISGLYLLHKVRALGLNAKIVDAAGGVGGTWYWNCYPGARCDIESRVYCYSFSPELRDEWRWSARFAEQPEILRYLNHVADRFDLRRDIILNTRIRSAAFDEAHNVWRVDGENGFSASPKYLLLAIGTLSSPNKPDLPGIDAFAGDIYHSSQWPQEGVDFTGKRVGVVGTGSSGIQMIPVIAKQAEHLTVFQRTATYTLPARNRKLTPDDPAEATIMFPKDPTRPSLHDFTDEERESIFEHFWEKGSFDLLASFRDLVDSPENAEYAGEFVRKKIRQTVTDPKTAASLCPDITFNCKRMCIDSGYYETFNRDNVTLVDMRIEPIRGFRPNGVETSDGFHEIDVLALATGFDAGTGAFMAFDIRGVGGVSLRDVWKQGSKTYLGIGVPGFPNMLIAVGPGSPGSLSIVTGTAEQQGDWIADMMQHFVQTGVRRVEVRSGMDEEWSRRMNEVGANTLIVTGGCDSWYLGANIEGKPRGFFLYPDPVGYRTICDEEAANGYPGFELAS